jgi:putative SOS response-associated peptidase YedK
MPSTMAYRSGPLLWMTLPHMGAHIAAQSGSRQLGRRSRVSGGRKPINAKCETVRDLPTCRDAYRSRRCILPVDGFFEWKAIKGQKAKQPYAIAMKDGSPFGIAGIWENWKEPATGE